jgi:TRAP transporter 4TM/12TM fusion protein
MVAASRFDHADVPSEEVQRVVIEKEFGGRRPPGSVGAVIYLVALSWALFQLYIISPLPFVLGSGFVLDSTQARLVFYAFTIFLVFCDFPAFSHSPRDRVPFYDWALALVGAATSLYIFFLYDELVMRSGAPTPLDIAVASIGILILFEATRRAVGIPLTVVAMVCIAYTFLGPYMPDVLAHRFTSLGRVADHMWLSTQGVFGIPLGIATDFVFLFVMFGAMLEKAGAGTWFMQSSFALLGHLRGGPAKASVVASAFFGMISGSALANVVTTGTFTIPLMKRTGFPAVKAAAIESSSSINGQVMPPVMGAVAFMIMEFVGVSYLEVITHAFLPAIISYIGLYYIVHLEAVKLGLQPRQKLIKTSILQSTFRALIVFVTAFIGVGALYYTIGFVRAPEALQVTFHDASPILP